MSISSTFRPFKPGNNSVLPLPFKAHKVCEFSPEILETHYESFYGAAVQQLNNLELEMAQRDVSTVSEKNRAIQQEQEARLNNEILLHEVYFDCIGESGGQEIENAALNAAMCAAFSDVNSWSDECQRLASEHGDKDGWIVLAWSERSGRLLNLSVSDVTWGFFGVTPVLALDLSAHAYVDHFGDQREKYVKAFLRNIDWQRVGVRFALARQSMVTTPDLPLDDTQISVAQLKALIDGGKDVPLILDVRHDDDRERYSQRVMQTDWRDSFNVGLWAGDIPEDVPVVVYCMYGFWVSQKVAEELRCKGIRARSLSGGVTAWRAMGYSTTDNEIKINPNQPADPASMR